MAEYNKIINNHLVLLKDSSVFQLNDTWNLSVSDTYTFTVVPIFPILQYPKKIIKKRYNKHKNLSL